MARRIQVIGIGAGNPDHMTIEAIKALNACDVLFIPTKGDEKSFLAELRQTICDTFIAEKRPRQFRFVLPERHRGHDYPQAIETWYSAVAETYQRLFLEEMAPEQTAGILVWGDPMLYDGTIRILNIVRNSGKVAFDFDVIPGITSLQALCARHRIPLNRVGGAVQITTGRRLAAGWPEGIDDIAVMLDEGQAYETIDDPSAEILWGAYVGTPMEILISGRLMDVAPDISRARKAARTEHGWIMDAYIIRRRPHASQPDWHRAAFSDSPSETQA